MANEILEPLYARLIEAEEQYRTDIHQLEGLQKVIIALRKLGQIRENKQEQGEDVEPLDRLIESSYAKLQTVLDCMEENMDHGVIFHEWAHQILADLRARDPLMLSFDSDGESVVRSRRGNQQSEATFRTNRQPEAISSRGTSGLLTILKSNGKLKEKKGFGEEMESDRFFFLTTLAWSIAVIGMLITIGFLAADFWYAQQNVAIQVERSDPTPLELPAITLCNDLQNIPTFVDYPTTEYPGLPLFGISTYIRSNSSSIEPELQVSYPDTLPTARNSVVEEVAVSENSDKCSNVGRGFDVNREMNSLRWIGAGSLQGFTHNGINCLHCFRIGYKRRELLQPYDTLHMEVLSPAIQIKIFKSRMFKACQDVTTRRDPLVDLIFASELESFAKDLEKRGTLDFNGHDYSVLNQTQRDITDPQHINFYCNVYFFSGFFYPSLSNASIQYRYEPETEEKWVKSGTGPFYSAYSWNEDDALINGPDPTVLERDTYAISALHIFAEEASTVNASRGVLPQTSISILDSPGSSVYTFKRVNRRGKNEFEVKQASNSLLSVSWRILDEYYIGFDYETFETETILTMATMSWPEFVTDVFEFIGLFTGICIFTLIVAPAHSFGFRAAQ